MNPLYSAMNCRPVHPTASFIARALVARSPSHISRRRGPARPGYTEQGRNCPASRKAQAGDGEGRPMIACFDTCLDSIRTIPMLQHDPDRVEDLDTDAEDHAADEWH
jgi:hypothetical protein